MVNKYKNTLLQAGYMPISEGNIILSNSAENLFRAWIRILSSILSPYYSATYQSPLFIDQGLLETSKYFEHFPHQLFQASTLEGSDRKFITPATCLHIYQLIKNKEIGDQGFRSLIYGRCTRVENNKSEFPFRLNSFNMLEIVLVGSETKVNEYREQIYTLLNNFFSEINFNGKFITATDAFFLGNDEGAKAIQKIKELKKEYIVTLGKEKIAIASINNHEEYFGKLFNIKSSNNAANSICIAFGIERLTAYSLIKWGTEQEKWPKEFR